MSRTEDRTRDLVSALFEEAVTPLAEARKARGQQAYFPLGPEPGAKTYYDEPPVRVMRPEDFEFPGGGTAQGLVSALVASWEAEGEEGLAAMGPRLAEIALVLEEEAQEGDGSISVLCYTMF